ncbi:MAG: Ig-like domain-containing protein [Planctomycetota bacterium]
MDRIPRWMFILAIAVLPVMVAGCGSGSSSGGQAGTGGTLVLLDVSVGDFDGVPLNEIIEFEFSDDLNPDTVRPDTIQIRLGPNWGKQVAGDFEVEGRFVKFFPRLPVLPDLSDGGLQPASDYRITLPGQPKVATVRSSGNDRLKKKFVHSFRTAAAGDPNLFRDNFIDPLPPTVLFVNPPDGAQEVPADSEITITFNRRPLHPATVNTSNITLTMVERMGVPVSRPISGTPTLTQSHDSVVVVFVPTFPLADDATYELHVDRRVADLVGNDIEPSFDSTFSIRDEPPRYSEITWNYTEIEKQTLADLENTTASWNEAVENALAALFTVAGGNGTAGDLAPTSNQQFDPSDFPRGHEILTEDGQSYDVYNFRSINIPNNVVVRFEASDDNYPAKLLSLKPIQINGTLTISGGDGENGEKSGTNTKLVVAKGGESGPGGTSGADSYSGTVIGSSVPTQDGPDVEYGGGGGKGGGSSAYSRYCYAGGGGGGGSRTPGKDGTRGGYNYSSWAGAGGKGGKSATERGYPPNEERQPNVGGAGGGSGGLGFYGYYSWRNGGAGGGGGGGAITLQGASSVTIGSTGRILADGGPGGDQAPRTSYYGGAAGGGGGGSILIRATGTMTFGSGATLSVAGGTGGLYTWTYTYYKGGEGGDGGTGYIRLEAREDENAPGKPLITGDSGATMTYPEYSKGVYAPKGGGAPSVGQTTWENLGVFDPIMVAPKVEDIVATLYNDSMTIEVQMAIEDQNNLGNPNLNAMDITDSDGDGEYDDTLNPAQLSEWTNIYDIEDLNGNGHQYLRTRITFQLDDEQTPDHPLPYLDFLRVRFKF